MAFLNWDETFATNIKKFDADHKKLISLINEVYEKVFQCEHLDEERNLTEQTLNSLLEYIKYHFTAEETLMIKLEYPGYAGHKAKHDYYIAEVNKMLIEHKQGGSALSFPVFMLLKEWIAAHILVEDKQYTAFFHGKGID